MPGRGDGEEADGREDGEAPAHAVGDDELPIALVPARAGQALAQRVQQAARRPRRHHDPPVRVVEIVLEEAADEAEGEGGLQRAPAFGDHVRVDALPLQVLQQPLVVARREVVPGEHDRRALVVRKVRRERRDHSLRSEVRPADPDADEDVGALADLVGHVGHAVEHVGVGREHEIAPAEHVAAGAGAIEDGLVGSRDAGLEVGTGVVVDERGGVAAVEGEHGRRGWVRRRANNLRIKAMRHPLTRRPPHGSRARGRARSRRPAPAAAAPPASRSRRRA